MGKSLVLMIRVRESVSDFTEKFYDIKFLRRGDVSNPALNFSDILKFNGLWHLQMVRYMCSESIRILRYRSALKRWRNLYI